MLEIRDWLNNHQYSADQMKENCLCQLCKITRAAGAGGGGVDG